MVNYGQDYTLKGIKRKAGHLILLFSYQYSCIEVLPIHYWCVSLYVFPVYDCVVPV